MAKAEYRSSARSRDLLKSALLSMLKDMDLDEITVSALAQKAGVNRGTFYAHYKNISEVLESIQSDVARQLALLFRHLNADSIFFDCESILSACIDFLGRSPDYYRALLTIDNGKGMLDMWRSNLINYLESSRFLAGNTIRNAVGNTIRNAVSYRCAINFAINGAVGMIADTLAGKTGIMLEVLPKELARFITGVLGPYFQRD